MKVISITGGVGSGKSEVLRLLKDEFGAGIIMADEVAHQLMEPGMEGFNKVLELLGPSILSEDGSIDRKKMAARIFKDKAAVAAVNGIIHPLVWDEIKRRLSDSNRELMVVEAALFDEEHNAMFDEIWYIYTSEENRISRLMASRGYTEEKCREIMKNQAAEAQYRRFATRVIDNNGSTEELREQLEKILDSAFSDT